MKHALALCSILLLASDSARAVDEPTKPNLKAVLKDEQKVAHWEWDKFRWQAVDASLVRELSANITIPAGHKFVTVVVDDARGVRVRNLLDAVEVTKLGAKGDAAEAQVVAVEWNGLDDYGRSVPDGTYQIRGCSHPGLKCIYEYSFLNPGSPPWEHYKNSGWSGPKAMAASDGLLWIALGGGKDIQRIKYHSGGNAPFQTSKGPQPVLKFDEDLWAIAVGTISVDDDGALWVAENADQDRPPACGIVRRIAVWDRDGQFAKDFVGTTWYGANATCLHEQAPTLGYGYGVIYKLEPGKKPGYRPLRYVSTAQPSDAPFWIWTGAPWTLFGEAVVAKVALAHALEHLWLLAEVEDPTPWKNAGSDPKLAFKTGDAVDVLLGPERPDRTAPIAGDIRVLIAPGEKGPVVMAYRPIKTDAKPNSIQPNGAFESSSNRS